MIEKAETKAILEEMIARYPALAGVRGNVEAAFETVKACFARGGRLYLCGNGGSSSDCEHIAGELIKSFKKKRPLEKTFAQNLSNMGDEGADMLRDLEGGLPAISLCGHPGLTSAFSNDKNPSLVFAQQLSVFGRAGDVLLTLSTSGNSRNCVYAAIAARAMGIKVVFLGGGNGGKLKEQADVSVVVPETETFKVQELHLPVYHALCAMLESEFFA